MISSFFSSLDSLGLAAPSSDAAFPTVPPGWGPSFFDCSDCSDSDFCSTGRLATHGLGQHSWTFAPRKNHADASLQACQKGRDHRSSFPFGQSIDRCSPLGPLRFLVVAFDRGPSAKRIAKSAKFSTGPGPTPSGTCGTRGTRLDLRSDAAEGSCPKVFTDPTHCRKLKHHPPVAEVVFLSVQPLQR